MECEAFRDDQLEVLYGEADAATARRVSEHHAGCAACREEMASFRRVRRDLTAWTLPASVGPRRVQARRAAPWLAAAAAVLAALGTGYAVRPGGGAGDVESLLARQETRHRAEVAALRAELAPAAAASTPRPVADPRAGGDDLLLRRMQEMIRDSEARQDARVSARLAALTEESETQRRYDLARVSAGLSYLEGRTGQDMVRTTELMGRVLQASQQK